MKTLTLLSLVGVVSIVLTDTGWAAGRGRGEGGFHGGGFGGGRGFGGGIRAGGFGGVRSSSFSSLGTRPSYRQPVYDRPVNRSVTPSVRSTAALNRQPNRFALPSNRATQVSPPANRSVTTPARAITVPQNALNGRTDHIHQREAAPSHADWDPRRAYYSNNHWWAYNGDGWIGLDAGFYPWDYYPYYTYDYYPYDYFVSDPTDLPSAYQGTTSSPPPPDPTVTAVQTQLSQQGYYGGPVDGLFGPTTRDAVARYQTQQNLTVTGSLTPDTLQALGLSQVATN